MRICNPVWGGKKIEIADIKYGYLYNWYVTANIANTGWRVPSEDDLKELADNLGADGNYTINSVGGKLKETGFTYWDSPNEGATNEVNFNARGAGYRTSAGGFTAIKLFNEIMASTSNGGENSFGLLWNEFNWFEIYSDSDKESGQSVRLLRDSTSTETGMDDGTIIPSAYTGNDGKVYNGVKIGSQVWITTNLAETKYNNGTDITEVTDNSTWAGLTTGARCSYLNDEETYAFN